MARALNGVVCSDDSVPEAALSTSFAQTSKAWAKKFGSAPYTYCGCDVPGEGIGKRFSRMIASFNSSSSIMDAATATAGNAEKKEKEEKKDGRATDSATHPSDHNVVQGRVTSKERRAHQSKFDKTLSKASSRAADHDTSAFYYPIPLYFNSMRSEAAPFVERDGTEHGFGECVSVTGRVVDGSEGGVG